MKKYIFSILLILLVFIPAQARNISVVNNSMMVIAGGACTVDNDSVLIEQATTDINYDITTTQWKAQQFTYGSNITITQIDMYIGQDAGVGNATISLRADSSNLPTGADIANTTINVPYTSIGATEDWISFVFTTPYSYTASTLLHIIVRSDQTTSYFINIENSDAYASGVYSYSTDGGSSWSNLAGYDAVFRVYGCLQ